MGPMGFFELEGSGECMTLTVIKHKCDRIVKIDHLINVYSS